MIIDLNIVEWDMIERLINRTIVLAEMLSDDDFRNVNSGDLRKAKKLLDKFVIGRQ